MQIELIKENEDGSADYRFDMTEEEKTALLRWAIVEAIKNTVKEAEKLATDEDYKAGETD